MFLWVSVFCVSRTPIGGAGTTRDGDGSCRRCGSLHSANSFDSDSAPSGFEIECITLGCTYCQKKDRKKERKNAFFLPWEKCLALTMQIYSLCNLCFFFPKCLRWGSSLLEIVTFNCFIRHLTYSRIHGSICICSCIVPRSSDTLQIFKTKLWWLHFSAPHHWGKT